MIAGNILKNVIPIHRSAEDEEILADAWYFELTHLQRGLALNVNRILV